MRCLSYKSAFGGLLGAVLMAGLLLEGPLGAGGVQWSGKDVSGKAVKVPAAGPSVLLFVQAEQEQSKRAIEELKAAVSTSADVQVIAIVSGKDAEAAAKRLAEEAKFPWPVVADPDYASSGEMSVHAWPTTLVIRPDGQQVGHLPGLSKSYDKDIESYLAYAAGKIDEATLSERLGAHPGVLDSPEQMAQRHLRVARRLMDKGLAEQAKVELQAGLKLQP